ncbi:Proto-oncogene tyrosine-protein kinase receptor Ret [Araneus ventricosus]|uniref:Proto-oncogene tyrosine-protein kinase receptor Ret n=1 Tax=Araneus ventricosus TaxID=182803 RepID=A0A4Y2PHF0_ARAVE|nr:Proto-oncogene tyrosine-protein kinase receptor Ret [Araneus ventricosus]
MGKFSKCGDLEFREFDFFNNKHVTFNILCENGGLQEKQDLITEFLLLKEISHPNIVRLLGASTEKNGQFYLIVEFAEMGSLRSYLRKRRRHNNCCKYNATYGFDLPGPMEGSRDYYQFPCERSRHEPNHSYFHKEQLSFAWQIAKGMSYLSDMKLVHRDLATRNVLLAKHRVVKISDFGLSRDIYEGDAYLKRTKGRVPVKWMAIESLEDQIYTSRSDV